MSYISSTITHEDLIGINNFIIESLEHFINIDQYNCMYTVFAYLEHLQSSNYNFINVNSINNDMVNNIYTFKINKVYYQFNQSEPDKMAISCRTLLITVKNALIFLTDVKNKENNYSFSYITELIQSSFNSIIRKLINLHKFAKNIERKQLSLIDAIMFFNNVVSVFNEKFEILKTFTCVDNIMYIYYFDVDRDFSKSLICKIYLPQIKLDAQLQIIDKPNKVSLSNIFTPAYASFFNNNSTSYNEPFMSECKSVCFEYNPSFYSDEIYVFNPDNCVHTHQYNPLTNIHTHIYNTNSCVHTILYDPSLCIHTHQYDPTLCCHKYVYDSYHCYKELKENDISLCSYTIVYDTSGCKYTFINENSNKRHIYDSLGCKYQIVYDDMNLCHTIEYSPQLCDHDIFYNYDCSKCIHTYIHDFAKHVIVTDISESSYLKDMSNCIYKYIYNTDHNSFLANYNDINVDFNEINNISYTKHYVHITDNSTVHSIYDPSLCSFTNVNTYENTYTITIDNDIYNSIFTFDPSTNPVSKEEFNISEQTIMIDTSYNDAIIVLDTSIVSYNHDLNLTLNINIDTYDSQHCKGIVSYIDNDIKTISNDECSCSQIYQYDLSGLLYNVQSNIITAIHTIYYDTSQCNINETTTDNIHTITYTVLDKVLTIIYDDVNCVSNRSFDISLNMYIHRFSVIHKTCIETNIDTIITNRLLINAPDSIFDMKYTDDECTIILGIDLSTNNINIADNVYTVTGITVYSILSDVSGTIITSLDVKNNYQYYLFKCPVSNVDISVNSILTSSNEQIRIDSLGCQTLIQYDISSCVCRLTVDPSNCEISGNTFTGLDYVFILDGSLNVIDNVYTYVMNDISINEILDISENHINTFTIEGLTLIATYDLSLCIYKITIDPLLCNIDISNDTIFTFDVSGCKHILTINDTVLLDISDNIYTFIVSGSAEIFNNTFTYIEHIDTFTSPECTVTISYNNDRSIFDINYDISRTNVTIEDVSLGVLYRYDISDTFYEIIFDISNLTINEIGHHQITVFSPVTRSLIEPVNALITHEHNVSGCYNTFVHNTPLIETDISYCTHKHIFVQGEECTLFYNPDEHSLRQIYNNCKRTLTSIYDTSQCKHTLIYDYRTKTYKHEYNKTLCNHQYVYDLSNCIMTYQYDISEKAFLVTYNSNYCTHDSSKKWIIKNNLLNAYTHSYVNGNSLYGYLYMCGKMLYNYDCNNNQEQVSCNPNESTFEYYSKIINPIYNAHIVKGNNYYDSWSGFNKVLYHIFDSDMIGVTNQAEFIISINSEYVRFTPYDITTDVFYKKLVAFNTILYRTINSDFKGYQASKEFISDNIFTQQKLLLFKQIYDEYLCFIEMLNEDLQNLLLMVDTIPRLTLNIQNESILLDYYNRFNRLYNDINKNVLLSACYSKYDMYYIGHNESLTLFATNYNMIVSRVLNNCKMNSITLIINRVTLTLYNFSDEYTNSMIKNSYNDAISNIIMIKILINANVKNMNNLLKITR